MNASRALPFLLLLLLLTAAACNCDPGGELSSVGAKVRVDPRSIDFGEVSIGTSARRSIEVENTGDFPVTIDAPAIDGNSSFRPARARSFSLAPAQTLAVELVFEPDTEGAFEATLELTGDGDPPRVLVALRGTGVLGPAPSCALSVQPASIDFGDVAPGAAAERSIIASGSNCTIVQVELDTQTTELSLLTSIAVPIDAGSVELALRYAPIDAQEDRATLVIITADQQTIEVPVRGGAQIVPPEAGQFLYYWQIDAEENSNIVRLPLQGAAPPTNYWGTSNGSTTGCPGCHQVSPDGRYIAVVELADDVDMHSLYVIDTETNTRIALPAQATSGFWFSWRPDVNASPHHQYAVASGGIIFTGSLETGAIEELQGANDRAYGNAMPSWGPDGEVVFVRGSVDPDFGFEGATDLMLVAESGGTAIALPGASHNGVSNYYPAYSPNGLWISFTQAHGDETYAAPDAQVRLVRADRSGTVLELPLINGRDGASSFPTWSIDGSHLSISSNRAGGAGSWDIYIAAIDPVTGAESAPENLRAANTANFEHAAQWSP